MRRRDSEVCGAGDDADYVVAFCEESFPVGKDFLLFFIESRPVCFYVFGFCGGFAEGVGGVVAGED